MKNKLNSFLLLILPLCSSCTTMNFHTPRWKQLPSLPDPIGFAGMFAGVSDGVLIAGGGANFPDAPPWKGGKKIWHDDIFVLEQPEGQWKRAGKLPGPRGYGVSINTEQGVFCIGGSSATAHHAEAFLLFWRDGRVRTTAMPPLPVALANLSGAQAGTTVYVFGGITTPDASAAENRLFAIDLAGTDPRWRELEPCPGAGRIFPIAAARGRSFFVFGGSGLSPGPDGKPVRRYLRDTWRYTPDQGWKRCADAPHALVAGPSPAPVITDPASRRPGILMLAYDDGSQVATPPERHPGFRGAVLSYDPGEDAWTPLGAAPAGRVTTACTPWRGMWVVPSGESRPGVRSPEVWAMDEP